MPELVIVVADLFLSQETPERDLPPGVSVPGLQHTTRFGTRTELSAGWRAWLPGWLAGRDTTAAAEGAVVSPATVAAVGLMEKVHSHPGVSAATNAWIATPVHLITGMTSLHLDRRGTLRLSPEESTTLAADFQRVFHDSGFTLHGLASGDFLLLGRQPAGGEAVEPARLLGSSIADSQRGARIADRNLRRLGAEVEMWLHDHAVNQARERRNELPVSGLWFWGGGAIPTTRDRSAGVAATTNVHPALAFGSDAFLDGLWAQKGDQVLPLPQQLDEVFGYPQPRRAVLVIEISSMLNANPRWTFFDALSRIDRSYIEPAVQALRQGRVTRLVLIANDHRFVLRARDRLKFWRRTPSGLSGLQ